MKIYEIRRRCDEYLLLTVAISDRRDRSMVRFHGKEYTRPMQTGTANLGYSILNIYRENLDLCTILSK